jgi:hypothetical protein
LINIILFATRLTLKICNPGMNIANNGLFTLTQEEEATAYQTMEALNYPNKKLNFFNSNSTDNYQFRQDPINRGYVEPRN